MPKPTELHIRNKSNDVEWVDNHVKPLGHPLDFKADGMSGDNNGGRKTCMLVRIFYRVNGIPYAHTLYNDQGEDKVGGSGSLKFQTIDDATMKLWKFEPKALGKYSVLVIAWDNRNKPRNGDLLTKQAHIRVH